MQACGASGRVLLAMQSEDDCVVTHHSVMDWLAVGMAIRWFLTRFLLTS